MTVDIHHIIGGVVIQVVFVEHAPHILGALIVPVSGEVDDAQAAVLAIIGRVITVAVKRGIVAVWLGALAAGVVVLGEAQLLVVERGGIGALEDLDTLPVSGIAVPGVEQACIALPGVEIGRQRGLTAIGNLAHACAHFGKHEERALVETLVLVLLAQLLESRDKGLVEGESADVPTCVDAESVDTHLDKRAVAVDEILVGFGILGVQVHAVAGNLCPPAVGFVPVEVAVVVPQVVCVVVHAVGVLHLGEAVLVLLSRGQVHVVVVEQSALRDGVGHHALLDVALGLGPVAVKEVAQVGLAKVAGVIEHNVENHFHALAVCGIDEVLKLAVVALISLVHLAHVHGMVAVVVHARSILHHRGNPHCGEAERLDVVKFFNQSFEVAAPFGVLLGSILDAIPAVGVVLLVAVIKACGDYEVDGFVAKVGTAACHLGTGFKTQGEQQARNDG